MLIQLDRRFKKRVEGMFGKYDFQVGILVDKPHRQVQDGSKDAIITTYAGGPVRKAGRQLSGVTIAQVSKENRERMGFNYLTKPFEDKSSDIVKFTNEFFKLVFGRSEKRRAENLLQAVVRNPILRGDYGPNSPMTILHKGFNRNMMDTAQLFKAIVAKCTVRSSRV